MDVITLLVALGSMGVLGAMFSAGLALANRKLYVEEDPRVAVVTELLPGINCGACGHPGCANFAENLVIGRAEVTDCSPSTAEAIKEIAAVLGIEAVVGERKLARVLCQGGIHEAAIKAKYIGIQSCLAADLMSGGEKACEYGCHGFGDCVIACPFNAMYLNDNGLPVVIDDKCTGCGKCVEACPRDIIELHPVSHKLFVLCKNHDSPKVSRKVCTKACIGCQICVREAEEGQMFMDDNLAVVDYEVYGQDDVLPTDRCPTDCLVIMTSETAQIEEIALS